MEIIEYLLSNIEFIALIIITLILLGWFSFALDLWSFRDVNKKEIEDEEEEDDFDF